MGERGRSPDLEGGVRCGDGHSNLLRSVGIKGLEGFTGCGILRRDSHALIVPRIQRFWSSLRYQRLRTPPTWGEVLRVKPERAVT